MVEYFGPFSVWSGGYDGDEFRQGPRATPKNVWSWYAACANVYLASTYSDCSKQMDDILENTIEGWGSLAGNVKIGLLQACLILKPSNYWWKEK